MYHNHLRNLIICMGLIVTPFLVLLLWDEVGNFIANSQSESKVASMARLTEEEKDGEIWPLVYHYSPVNGGGPSVQELRSAIWLDPVVARHYLDFGLDRARVIEAKADSLSYVSYWIDREIYWAKEKLNTAKDEMLITDATNFTITHPGDMLSGVPQGKTSPDEPMTEVLDKPVIPPIETIPLAPLVVIGGGLPSPVDGSGDWGSDGDGKGNPPVSVPEPTTILLLGSGLSVLLVLRKKFRK
jgi:hypothetical protein